MIMPLKYFLIYTDFTEKEDPPITETRKKLPSVAASSSDRSEKLKQTRKDPGRRGWTVFSDKDGMRSGKPGRFPCKEARLFPEREEEAP